jgi:hypothetical protein
MAKIEKIKLPNGAEADAEDIDITQSSEHWNQYLLEDGTTIKMKLVATKIVRLVGQFDQLGNPVYFVNSTNVVSVECPSNLKKK